jgi:hypothetical protein
MVVSVQDFEHMAFDDKQMQKVETPDLASMTNKEMFDYMRSQIQEPTTESERVGLAANLRCLTQDNHLIHCLATFNMREDALFISSNFEGMRASDDEPQNSRTTTSHHSAYEHASDLPQKQSVTDGRQCESSRNDAFEGAIISVESTCEGWSIDKGNYGSPPKAPRMRRLTLLKPIPALGQVDIFHGTVTASCWPIPILDPPCCQNQI